jgi:hypothetical protein
VQQPVWGPDGCLYFVGDASGWWNIYRLTPQDLQQAQLQVCASNCCQCANIKPCCKGAQSLAPVGAAPLQQPLALFSVCCSASTHAVPRCAMLHNVVW